MTDAYERRCAVTGEKTLPVLEAAHIRPYALLGPHRVNNGLLLRSDLHKLFDLYDNEINAISSFANSSADFLGSIRAKPSTARGISCGSLIASRLRSPVDGTT